jgi:hypothetical protein
MVLTQQMQLVLVLEGLGLPLQEQDFGLGTIV